MMGRREKVIHSSSATVRVEYAGSGRVPLRVLFTQAGPFIELIEYFMIARRSEASQRNVVTGVALLIDFLSAHPEHLRNRNDHFALALFAQALLRGTINAAGEDASGLLWHPLSAKRCWILCEAVCGFADWLVESRGAELKPLRRAPTSWAEVIILQRRFERRKARSLLSHTYAVDEQMGRGYFRPGLERLPVGTITPRPAFPEASIGALLYDGFGMPLDPREWPSRRWNARDAAITVLMHGAGVRISQCFHLWIDDVGEDPYLADHARIRIYHPEEGLSPPFVPLAGGSMSRVRRAEYLRLVHGAEPRNLRIGTGRAGWKEPALDDPFGEAFLPVFWFPAWWGKLFWQLWKFYIRFQRPKAATTLSAWVNLSAKYSGLELNIGSHVDVRKAAIRRIGLSYSKAAGTTPHGHRHAYGRRLEAANISRALIQRCMHHKSIDSQSVYTAREIFEINDMLGSAVSKMGSDSINTSFFEPVVAARSLGFM